MSGAGTGASGDRDRDAGRARGQLVLLAAVALAVALVPLTVVYLQLGYGAEVAAGDSPIRDASRTLGKAVEDAADGVPEEYAWSDRGAAVTAVRDRLRSTLATLNTSRLDAGRAYAVTYNASRAGEWADDNCPNGPDRQFGSCRADRGVVVQERAGRTHVLAVAIDVETVGPGETRRATVVRESP
ncbi:MAG: hypothetical protein ABEH56_07385 [Salinirussus sp.]